MDRELEKRLGEEIPFFKREFDIEPYSNGANIFQSFGCQCGNGWYELLLNCGKEILACYEQADMPVDIVIEQIKEKFSTLRVYYSFSDGSQEKSNPGIQAIDFLGNGVSLRIYPEGEGDKSELRKNIGLIIAGTEKLSASVCESCGKPGKSRMDLRWKQTLCDDHYQERISKIREFEAKNRK